MPTIDEAVAGYITAIKSMDVGTLMATLTPEALGKAMRSLTTKVASDLIASIEL